MSRSTRPGARVTARTVTIRADVATLVAAASPSRIELSLCNIGANRATLSHASAVVADVGWPLGAAGTAGDQGGGYEWSSQDGTPNNALYVISASGTTIAVLEVV